MFAKARRRWARSSGVMRILCLGGFLTFAFLAGLVFVFFGGRDVYGVLESMAFTEVCPQSRGGNPLHRQAAALKAIRPAEELLDRTTPAFGLSPRRIGRRVKAAAEAAGLGEGFTGTAPRNLQSVYSARVRRSGRTKTIGRNIVVCGGEGVYRK